jgi:hypothetical protein
MDLFYFPKEFAIKIHDKIIIDIDIIMISIEDKTKLLKYIETTLKYLISNYAYFLKNHPKIKSSLEVNFKKYFLSKYNLQLYLKKEKFVSNSIFNYKYSESVLKKLYQISITDSLTSLYNRRYFQINFAYLCLELF